MQSDKRMASPGGGKVRLTKTVVAEAEPRPSDYVVWDNRVAGFGLRVRPSGGKAFVFVYRTAGGRKGSKRRVTIKATNPDVALAEAKKLAGQYHGGADPAEDKAKEAAAVIAARSTPSVAQVLDSFIADYAKA